jgi:hypothetical protein
VRSKQDKSLGRITSLLLLGANLGSLVNVKWFLSGHSLAHYEQFAADHPNGHRVKRISQSSDGFKGTVEGFLESRSKLAVLCCLMSKPGSEGFEILSHLIEFMPEAVNARSSAGDTPLLLAFRFQNLQAASMLIKAGADQTARNRDGGNLLHSLFSLLTESGGGNGFSYVPEATNENHYTHMRAIMDLLDPQLVPIICQQRAYVCRFRWYTPLASLLYHVSTPNSFLVSIVRMILESSGGAELDLLDNEGNTPLHLLVYKNTPPTHHTFYGVAALLLELRPDLMNMENKSGKTPLDMAQGGVLRAMCKGRHSLRSQGAQDNDFLYTLDEFYALGFSVTGTPEDSFTKESIDYDDFGGHEMARLLLSGAVDPSPSKNQRIVSLYRLLAETKANLDREGKGKRIITTASDILAAADTDNTQRLKEQHNDGYVAEMDSWLHGEREQSLIRAQFPGSTCCFCAHWSVHVPGPVPL